MATTNKDPNVKLVPTLDGIGWIDKGVSIKLDWLLANFFTSDGSQSSLYYRMFKTYQVINADNVNDAEQLRSSMEVYLQAYLSKFFDSVTVEVSLADLQGNKKNIYEYKAIKMMKVKDDRVDLIGDGLLGQYDGKAIVSLMTCYYDEAGYRYFVIGSFNRLYPYSKEKMLEGISE